MRVSRDSIVSGSVSVAMFLGFTGYSAALMLVSNTIGLSASRFVTIPLRLVIVGGLALAFATRPKLTLRKGLLFFWLFSALYLLRILVESFGLNPHFHRTPFEFFLYFTSFVLLPLSFLSLSDFHRRQYEAIFLTVVVGSVAFSLLTLVFYGQYLGEVARLSQVVTRNDNYISPLALSYGAALTMGVGISYLLANTVSRRRKLAVYAALLLSLGPFFLGASRGSIFSLGLPFVFQILLSRRFGRKVTQIGALLVFAALLYLATFWLGTNVFDRVLEISEAVDAGATSAVRVVIWQHTWDQFLASPIFGNSLESEYAGFHPHNVLLEVLISTGILGFTMFVLFLIQVSTAAFRIATRSPQYFWIVVIFLQALISNMFSGAIYGATWMALGAGLVLSLQTPQSPRRSRITAAHTAPAIAK